MFVRSASSKACKEMGSLVLQELWFMDAIHFIPCRAALRSPLKYRFSVLFRYGFLAFLVSFLSLLSEDRSRSMKEKKSWCHCDPFQHVTDLHCDSVQFQTWSLYPAVHSVTDRRAQGAFGLVCT